MTQITLSCDMAEASWKQPASDAVECQSNLTNRRGIFAALAFSCAQSLGGEGAGLFPQQAVK